MNVSIKFSKFGEYLHKKGRASIRTRFKDV